MLTMSIFIENVNYISIMMTLKTGAEKDTPKTLKNQI